MHLPDDPGAISAQQWREVQSALAPVAERTGVVVPRDELAPEVYIGPGTDIREVAIKLGEICCDHRKGLFVAGRELVTIDRATGTTSIMEPDNFKSWIADHALIGKKYDRGGSRLEKCSLGSELTRGIVASEHFRAKLPRLAGVNIVKQPVRRKNGTIELLQRGYDPESQIFTIENGPDYPENWLIDAACVYLRSLFGTFPWGDNGRSLAVHIAAGLTLFCQNMLPPGTLTPMFLYNANMAGSGKSVLVSVFLWALYGKADTMGIPAGEDEFKKELDACAQALAPYAFFDEQSGFIENRRLNAWITSRNWAGRILSTNRMFSMPKRAITFMAGNIVKLTPDLGRRTLIADLFSKQRLEDRKLPEQTILITDEWMEDEKNRCDILAAFWALVKHSCVPRIEQADPDGQGLRDVEVCGRMVTGGGTWHRARPQHRPLDSFETWSKLIPQIVVDAAFHDPLERPDLPDAGDKGSMEMDKLMKAVIRENLWERIPELVYDPDTEEPVETGKFEIRPLASAKVELSTMVATARRLGLFGEILDTTDLILVDLARARKGNGFWEEAFPTPQDRNPDPRLPETDAEKRSQAERWYDKAMAGKFANRFHGKQGQYFTGEDGALYQLGERVRARVSTFLITRV